METARRNKVYYGEYSIEYWITLLLKGNIKLPRYQRSFVWKPENVAALVETISANRFVPPITIGSFKDGLTQANYIVDGQQRLTSILLAVLGWFPDVRKWEAAEQLAVDRDDGSEDGEGDADEVVAVKWTYRELLKDGAKTTLDEVREQCEKSGRYIPIGRLELGKYGKSRCIGFSYLVPEDDGANTDYYANVFMDINGNGIRLSDQESRRSLYFLRSGLDDFFEPKFLFRYGITRTVTKNSDARMKVTEQLDFIRYLSIMNEYMVKARQGQGNVNIQKVAVGYRSHPEDYHKSFILTVAGREDGSGRFCSSLGDAHGGSRVAAIEALKAALNEMNVPRVYDSLADMDIAFFGMVYWVCYCGKKLDATKREEFGRRLEDAFKRFRDEPSYLKSTSQLWKVRQRIEQSVSLYREYAING